MDLKVIDKKADSLKVEVRGESHTLLNLLREKAWEAGAQQASYRKDHPYIGEPTIDIKSKDPAKTLKDAAQKVIDDAKDFEREFARAAK